MSTTFKREMHAHMGGLNVDDLARLMNNRDLESFTQAELLCVALPTPLKDLARAHYQTMILGYRGRKSIVQDQIASELARMQRLGLDNSPFDALKTLPPYSLAVEFRFTLAKPYLSRDDDAFYIIDNPVRKEKVFKVPYVAPSTWKGSLRATSTRLLLQKMERVIHKIRAENSTFDVERCALDVWPLRAQNVLLFGNEKGLEERLIYQRLMDHLPTESQECEEANEGKAFLKLKRSFEEYLKENGYRTDKIEGRQGRLSFFPTFFSRIGLEIINPHERKRGVGTNPILFECVPAGTEGKFALMYVPFDYFQETATSSPVVTPDESSLRRQVARDILQIGETISSLFTMYGFGAKTSSGFGTAQDFLTEPGRLAFNVQLPSLPEIPVPLPENIKDSFSSGDQITDFISSEGELRTDTDYEAILQKRAQNYNRKKKQLYKRVMRWWEEGGGKKGYQEHLAAQKGDHLVRTFSCLSDLPEVTQQISVALGGA